MSRGECVVKWRDPEGMVMSYRCHAAFVVLELCLGASGRDFWADRRRSKRFSRVSRLVFELLLWWGTQRFVIWACLHWFGLCLHLRETIFVDTQKICFSSCCQVFLGPSFLGDSQNRTYNMFLEPLQDCQSPLTMNGNYLASELENVFRRMELPAMLILRTHNALAAFESFQSISFPKS